MPSVSKPSKPEDAKAYFEAKMAFSTGPVELKRMLDEKKPINVVDVRLTEDYKKGHIPGAINLPPDQWKNLDSLKKDKNNILYCYSHVCHLAARAAVVFAGQGYPVMEMDGGFKSWVEHNLPIEK